MPWERRRYRRNKVWVEVDERGAPVLDDRGLAALRYKPEDERTYTVRPDDLGPVEAPPPAAAPEEPDQEPRPEPAAVEPPPGDGIVIYTDGASSGNPGPAGLGVLLLWREHRREIQRFLGEATNNQAELEAVLAGLRAVTQPGRAVAIHTDSEYVIGVLTKGHKVQANVELVAEIQAEMGRFAALTFVKVPAHAGVPGNERADRLARDAIRSGARD
ncbi:MAG: ribonuclease HI [Planctomycetota bacterium]|nr:ribonuclease HI [Planctomycetota bacterium]